MRILITNDDGAGAHGLTVLHQIAKALTDDVWIVAPEANQSGASHALTLQVPLRYREIGERAFAVRGTPADCVIMGVRHVLKDKPPDLILSGVNHGANLAEDVSYSGTIAGAMEGTLVGIRSIAMSLTIGFDPDGRQHWKTPLERGPATDLRRKNASRTAEDGFATQKHKRRWVIAPSEAKTRNSSPLLHSTKMNSFALKRTCARSAHAFA